MDRKAAPAHLQAQLRREEHHASCARVDLEAQKKANLGEDDFMHRLGKLQEEGPHWRLQTNRYPKVHGPSAPSAHSDMMIKKEDMRKAIECKNR